MGDAKKREAAINRGQPWPAAKRCPVKGCGSRDIMRHGPETAIAKTIADAWGNTVVCPIDQCRKCGAIWEPWPDDDPGDRWRDACAREPCDNCAYRKGSAEAADPEQWEHLKRLPVDFANAFKEGDSAATFACHKGIPIAIDSDGLRFDFKAADAKAIERTCVGFLRIVWAQNKTS